MRKRKTIPKAGADSNGAKEGRTAPEVGKGEMGIPIVPQQMDETLVKFGDMVRAMQYLTDEVTNLRYKLLQYELCQKTNRRK